jgi:hypothetical protein
MAAPTTLSLVLDLEEYSKFENSRDTITVSWTASGGGDMSGEQVLVQLVKARRSRDVVVYATTETIGATSDPVTQETTIHLPDLVDSDQLSLIRRGYYLVRVSSVTTPAVTADSADVPISIVTAQELRYGYLFGLELYANDVRSVKVQPQNITGVEIESVSSNHPMAFSGLNYIYSAGPPVIRQITWGGGPGVIITQPGRYVLRFDCSGSDYIVIRVRSLSALPTTNQVDELLVEKDQISDDMLRRWIDQSCDWWENDKISVFLEPTQVTTDPVLTGGSLVDYDFIVPPITFYPVIPARWIDILFPYPGLLRVDELFGNIANTRILDVDLSWLEISERNGLAQLVPFNQQVAFQYIGLVWVESLRGVIELPNFWHFTAMAGLRQVDPVILEILAKKAAVDALVVAGQAFRGGFSSQSLSRDGVSESVSYTASAIYGIYSATIEEFSKFINREIKYLRGRYRGLNMLVA